MAQAGRVGRVSRVGRQEAQQEENISISCVDVYLQYRDVATPRARNRKSL